MSVPDWIEHQIRTAQADGAFENLPGAGKPIPDLGRPQPELAWVANYLHREDVDVAALLPPALALAKEVEVLSERLLEERSEVVVRALIEDLNGRIARAHQQPQVGPPVRVRLVPVEQVVTQWRAAVAARLPPAPASVTDDTAPARRRFWFGRRSV
jgi:DnaJ-like protein